MKPDFLYRYTNIDSLHYILSGNHTIRFNPLTKMDDKTEMWCRFQNNKGVGFTSYDGADTFISCWTENEDEDIRMWKEYCNPNDSGIRIKLPINPFSMENSQDLWLMVVNAILGMEDLAYNAVEEKTGRRPKNKLEYQREMKKLETTNPTAYSEVIDALKGHMLDDVIPIVSNVDKILLQVEYTDDVDKIYPELHRVVDGRVFTNFDAIAKYKPLEWASQREWRYVLHFRRGRVGVLHEGFLPETYNVPFDHYDLKLDVEKLKQMEITLSPFIKDEGRKAVNDLVAASGLSWPRICGQRKSVV